MKEAIEEANTVESTTSIIDTMNMSTVSLESVSLDSSADASLIEGADSI